MRLWYYITSDNRMDNQGNPLTRDEKESKFNLFPLVLGIAAYTTIRFYPIIHINPISIIYKLRDNHAVAFVAGVTFSVSLLYRTLHA